MWMDCAMPDFAFILVIMRLPLSLSLKAFVALAKRSNLAHSQLVTNIRRSSSVCHSKEYASSVYTRPLLFRFLICLCAWRAFRNCPQLLVEIVDQSKMPSQSTLTAKDLVAAHQAADFDPEVHEQLLKVNSKSFARVFDFQCSMQKEHYAELQTSRSKTQNSWQNRRGANWQSS